MTRRAAPTLFDDGNRGPAKGANRRALGTTTAALRSAGRLERVDEAVVTLTRTLATTLDEARADPDESRFTVARLASTYQAALTLLLARPDTTPADELDGLLAVLSAPLGDSPQS